MQRISHIFKSHCHLRIYTFQIWKCDNRKCCSPIKNPSELLPWLPDPIRSANKEHFLQFDQIVGETTEKDCPSTMVQSAVEVTEMLQANLIPFSDLYNFLQYL